MPNRILKESICTNDQIDELTPFQETLFYRLIVKVDDFGRYDGRPKILKAALFPLKDNVKAADVKNAVDALAAAGLVRLYTVDGDPFVELTGWDRNQTIRAKKSKFPGSDEADVAEVAENTDSHTLENNCTQLHASACELNTSARKCSRNPNPNLNPIKEKDIERESPKRREVSKRPTLPEVAAFIEKNSLQVSAAAFMKYYESADWKTSAGNPVRDWKARVRMWAAESEDQKKKAAVNPNRFANFEQRDTDYNTLFGEVAS
jgi:hypothetical protein